MNLSLCGSGFLGIYHLGVLRALVSHGPQFLTKIQKVSGASAGALIGTVLVCSPDKLEVCKQFTLDLAGISRKKPLGPFTPSFNLIKPIREFLELHLPEDSYLAANDVLYISVTNLSKRRNEIVSKYHSNTELIECLVASCYIPVYAGISLPVINGHRYFDGGFTNNLYIFKEGRTVTVSPFCGGQDIAPIDDKGLDLRLRIKSQTFQINRKNAARGWHAFLPPTHEVLLHYYDVGYQNTVIFLKKENFYEK